MPHDDEIRVTGRRHRTRHQQDGPELEVLLSGRPSNDDSFDDDGDGDSFDGDGDGLADDGNGDGHGDQGAEFRVSTGQDEILDTDGMFDALAELAEADVVATATPLEIDVESDEEELLERVVATDGAVEGEDGEEEAPHQGGVGAVLERLQAADEAAASGAPVPLRASKKRLGEILVDMDLVTEEQIEATLARQKETRKRLGQLLLEDKIISELDLTRALATKFGIEYLDLTRIQIDMAAADLLSERL
ncbi:MAG TPA: hypothetical protein VK576_09225, partial [Thermoleophilia bacterium]|nr:hypothetical protein [Thermoleophilia bacterium]